MNNATTQYPNCNGKGHVTDILTGLVLFPLAWFEHNDPKGFTRDPCRTCDGKRFISVPTKKGYAR
jgi:hypothetical protein